MTISCGSHQLPGAGGSHKEGGGVHQEAGAGAQVRHCEAALQAEQVAVSITVHMNEFVTYTASAPLVVFLAQFVTPW